MPSDSTATAGRRGSAGERRGSAGERRPGGRLPAPDMQGRDSVGGGRIRSLREVAAGGDDLRNYNY